jgi:hypothetical protein
MTAKSITIFISCGYDFHSITVPKSVHQRIKGGQAVKVRGQGFPTDDGVIQDFWLFNHKRHRKVYVYCDDTRDVYEGDDYWVEN